MEGIQGGGNQENDRKEEEPIEGVSRETRD